MRFNPFALTIEQRRRVDAWRFANKSTMPMSTKIWWIGILCASAACLWKLAHCIPWGGQ